MSKIINKWLEEGDPRLVPLVSDGKVIEHNQGDYHSFYYPCGSGHSLFEISDWGYKNAVKDGETAIFGLLQSSEFITGVSVYVSDYLFKNGFSFDGRKFEKETKRGEIEGYSSEGRRQILVWKVTETDGYERTVRLDVTNSDPRFLVVLDKLLGMDPVKDCGLRTGSSYQIRYQGGAIGLCSMGSFTSSTDIIQYCQLMKVIQEIN